jgi:hypothetical protein
MKAFVFRQHRNFRPYGSSPHSQIVEMKPTQQQAISLEAKKVGPVKLKSSSKE